MRHMLLAAAVLVPSLARAEVSTAYEPGIVPEGMNAFIARRRSVHVSLLGTSQVTLGRDTELATYLLADLVLFPNLRVEHQLAESDGGAASILLGAGAGALPLAMAFAMPLPGAIVAGAGVGVIWGSLQSATLVLTGRSPSRGYSVSVNGGGFAAEGGFAAAGIGVGAGGGGAGGAGGTTSDSGHRFGATAGIEFDKTFGERDALVVALDGWLVNPSKMTEAPGVLYPRVTWAHRFAHWQLTGGAYALIDLPKAEGLKSKMPVAPFINVAWNH
jgi:hypothetical protein